VSAGVCPICGSLPADACQIEGRDRIHGVPGSFCVAVCSSCGGGWTTPPVSQQELAAFYPGSYQAYVLQQGMLGKVQRRGQQFVLARALRRVPLEALAHRTAGTVLDVGCGRGDLGEALLRRGWRVSGIDPSPSACALAEARGIAAHVGTLESVPLEEQSFDAAVMTHSLEHVVDPRGDLGRVWRLLRPGGTLVISLPNFGSWQRRRFGADWFPLELPRHRTHFTRDSLERALTGEGFEIVSLGPGSDNGFALLASLQYRLAGELVLDRPPQAWLGYAFSPVSRLIDLSTRDGALLNAVVRRPAAQPGRARDSILRRGSRV
jgi:2-polyprenyl-3-methyl-5-hydroxy-6-metoxy-1,4-benzoquinol methylase